MLASRSLVFVAVVASAAALQAQSDQSPPKAPLPRLTEVRLASSLDGEEQPVLYWAPETATSKSTPLLVFLHSWSGDYRQDNSKWQRQAVERGWIYLHPNFRGPNRSPRACGSKFARQDILDAMDFALSKFKVDVNRVYLAGTSGGGHMAMLMAGHHAGRFSAVSAWVGISDIAEWYRFHLKDGKPQKYAQMILKSLGGPPGENKERDADYRDRSPVFHLDKVGELPIQICAGINDGHTGSVPIAHSLRAFNVIARSRSDEVITDEVITRLSDRKRVRQSSSALLAESRGFGRDVLFKQQSGPASVIIFDGGHEGLPVPACEWLTDQRKKTSVSE